jgi:hypothetical protein
MRSHRVTLVVAMFASLPLFAQAPLSMSGSEAAVVAFAQEAAIRALNFKVGDVETLTHARADFTPEAWMAFMKWMGEFVDQKGAPKFSSSFVRSGETLVVGEENGIVHLKIPGTLRQSQAHGSTTYRASIDIQAGGTPIKIQHMEPTVCAGASTAASTPCG